jgi:hypothetical protein
MLPARSQLSISQRNILLIRRRSAAPGLNLERGGYRLVEGALW